MKKKYVLVAIVAVAMSMTACSLGSKEGTKDAGAVESKTIQAENTGARPADVESNNTDSVNTEPVNTEPSEVKAAESDEKEDSGAVEIPQGDPIVVSVDRYEDNVIVARDLDDEDIIYYFSTKDAEVIEGDSPIAAGDIVEITYQGVQGDMEHPGMAVKVVALKQ